MSDAAVDLGATALFGLTTTAGFHAQTSSTEGFSSEEVALSAIGNKSCTNEHNKGSNYSVTYKYCGITLRTNLGTMATAFGTATGGALPTGIDISFAVGQQAEITITGHNHLTNPHSGTNPPNRFNFASIIPAAAGLGVPSFITVAGETGSTASRSAATLSIAVNHIDAEGNSGHFVGESITCRADLSVDYEGVASTATAGSWLQILQTNNDANEAMDTSSLTAHQFIAAN